MLGWWVLATFTMELASDNGLALCLIMFVAVIAVSLYVDLIRGDISVAFASIAQRDRLVPVVDCNMTILTWCTPCSLCSLSRSHRWMRVHVASETGWTATGIILVVNASRFVLHKQSYSVWAFPMLFAQVAVLLSVRFITAIRKPKPLPPLAQALPSVVADQPRAGGAALQDSGLPVVADLPSVHDDSVVELHPSGEGVLADGGVHALAHAEPALSTNVDPSLSPLAVTGASSKAQTPSADDDLYWSISKMVGGRAHRLFYLLFLVVGGWGEAYNKRMRIDRTYGMDSEYVICVSCVFICLTAGELVWQGP